MAETMDVPVKGIEMEIERGQGFVQITIGPMTEKNIRKLAAAAVGNRLKVVIDASATPDECHEWHVPCPWNYCRCGALPTTCTIRAIGKAWQSPTR